MIVVVTSLTESGEDERESSGPSLTSILLNVLSMGLHVALHTTNANASAKPAKRGTQITRKKHGTRISMTVK